MAKASQDHNVHDNVYVCVWQRKREGEWAREREIFACLDMSRHQFSIILHLATV